MLKEKREIPHGYWRSLSSNLLGNLSVHLLWSWIKEIGVPHAHALAKLRPWVCRVVSCRVVRSRLKPQHYKTLTMSLNPTTFTEPLLSLNHDRTTLGALTVMSRFIPPAPATHLYKARSSSCSGCQFTLRYSCSGDRSLSPSVCCFLFASPSSAPRARYRREQSLRNLVLLLRSCSG
jgi:hypothetical protein